MKTSECFNFQKNYIYNDDSLKLLKKMPSESVDVIFADPPYFMQTEGKLERFNGSEFKGVDDNWDKFDSYKDYDLFTKKWLKECKRILKENGSIWVMGSFHNIFRLGYIMQDLNFWVLNEIVWSKTNPTPNFKGTRFVNAQETLIWATKSKDSKFTFNYKTMKSLNNNKQMKSIWNIGVCQGNERLKDNEGNKLHNTQKPLKLLDYVILASTKVDDLILDPFFGTGTTGASAKSLKRNFIGIEKDAKYIEYAKKRIEDTLLSTNYSDEIINNELDKPIKKIPFQKLIDKDEIKENCLLNGKGDKYCFNEKGELNINDNFYSIHKATKVVTNKYQNGWDYWYYFDKKENKKIKINELRKKYA